MTDSSPRAPSTKTPSEGTAPRRRRRRSKLPAAKPELREPVELERRSIERAEKMIAASRARYQVRYRPEIARVDPQYGGAGYRFAQAAAFGTTSIDFIDDAIGSLAAVVRGQRPHPSEQALNAALAFVDGGEPQNEIEADLLVQMVSTHSVAMQCLRTAAGNLTLATEGGVGNLAVKLLRTYTGQIEALAKLRRKGEQTVKVVHVYPGGQAVVGDVYNRSQEGGAYLKAEDQPDGTGESAISPALLGADPLGHSVPISGDAERQMSPARRKIAGRSEG